MGVTGARTVSAVEVLGNVEKYDGKALRVTGKISEVCASKGCWIRLAGPVGGETLFIKFTCPVGGRLVPMTVRAPVTPIPLPNVVQPFLSDPSPRSELAQGLPSWPRSSDLRR